MYPYDTRVCMYVRACMDCVVLQKFLCTIYYKNDLLFYNALYIHNYIYAWNVTRLYCNMESYLYWGVIKIRWTDSNNVELLGSVPGQNNKDVYKRQEYIWNEENSYYFLIEY